MVRFAPIALVCALAGVFAAPTTPATPLGGLATRSTPSGTGMNNGFYYSFYTDNTAQVTYTNGNAGTYTMKWSGKGDVVGGKGWATGAAR